LCRFFYEIHARMTSTVGVRFCRLSQLRVEFLSGRLSVAMRGEVKWLRHAPDYSAMHLDSIPHRLEPLISPSTDQIHPDDLHLAWSQKPIRTAFVLVMMKNR
jgi:hypothetical protein